MRSTKLYSILSRFTKIEQNRFRKFLQSPYFNRNKQIIQLFEYLAKDINSDVSLDMEKETVWSALNPDISYDDVRFRKYTSDLLKLLENFLAQQSYEQDPAFSATFLIEAIGEKKLEKLYKSAVKSAHRLSDLAPYESSLTYYHKYKIQRSYYNLTDAETRRADKNNIEDINRYLDLFYICEKLKFYLVYLSQQSVTDYDYKIRLIDDLLRSLEDHEYQKIPRIALYYQCCILYTEPENAAHYYKLKRLLKEYAVLLPPIEAKEELYNTAQNYCIKKINQNQPEFLKELFSLYQNLAENGILTAEGFITPWYYRNIVTTGLRLGEFDWINSFIFDYKDKLPSYYRENAFTFSLAQSYFYQKKFDKVIELLREVEYDDFSYTLNSKAMLLATYYETDEIEPLYSLFESFRVYLNRNKLITENRRQPYKNLIKFTKKLTNLPPGKSKEIVKIKEEINATPNIANKGWLKQKIAELERV